MPQNEDKMHDLYMFTVTLLTPTDLKDLKATTQRLQNEDKMHDLGTKL